MTLSMLLPWFPIILAVGVGGRLLGRRRGFALGLLCGMFWVLMVQSSAGRTVWWGGWTGATVLLGALSILLMGGWAGDQSTAGGLDARSSAGDATAAHQELDQAGRGFETLADTLRQFDEWLEEHREEPDPWPALAEFVRAALFQCVRATHVKLYRLSVDGGELIPVRDADPLVDAQSISARHGVVGHVVTTGRAFIRNDRAQGELVGELADASSAPVTWCFAITEGTRRLGVVVVGCLDLDPVAEKHRLRTVERMVNLCWRTVSETVRGRTAGRGDPDSGVYNRGAFLDAAERSIRESYAQGEPVAVALISVEGLRELNDSGRWEAADEVVRTAAETLRGKVRTDDCLGRFDGTQFIWLLRRVDAGLASLIVRQVMNRLAAQCADPQRWAASIRVRCGVVGSGTEKPDLRALICQALSHARRARLENVLIATELEETVAAAGANA